MKLYPPDPEITLYEVGFGDDDPYNRRETSKSLSDLVERIEDPLVITLDGGWGSGKTWFLKRWVGAHRLENDGRATTVYFDAFAHDFMDDPLIALTGVIGDRLPKREESKVWNKFKMAAAPFARIGRAVAISAISELAGSIAGAAAEATSKEFEAAAESFWKREDGKRAAMQQLRAALIELTMTEAEADDDPVPLVVVVDELDRCRPDYALALLEVIKHFFSVPNVHFVLGVSLEALGHSVRARYGFGIDAERYLRKFISVSLRLPDRTNDEYAEPLAISYFESVAESMEISNDAIRLLKCHLEMAAQVHVLTLRDMNQLVSRLALVKPGVFTTSSRGLEAVSSDGWRAVLASMLMFQLHAQELEQKALNGTLTLLEVQRFYGIAPETLNSNDESRHRHGAKDISDSWEFVITNGEQPEKYQRERLCEPGRVGVGDAKNVPRNIHRKYLGSFVLPGSQS
ncbi:KAP family P-loop NTPase fold protein [Paenirhodobacter sp.]|uniref:KAP family P-loop NTPase fold protein n=1 Tax=Paenirhodobacter sp. TaxID=1965326 RepID=UPI003B3EA71F